MPMDFKSKGLSWVGGICQKLETFCQEMDNIVTQDTVKYVGGQVHNVGENMKKFYSDVVQDLIPRSSQTQAMAQESSAANVSEHNGITEDLIPRSCETQAMAQESSAANGSEHHGFTEDLIPQSCETQAMAEESSATNGSEYHGFTEDLIPQSCETQAMAQESSATNGFTEDLIPQSCETQAMPEESSATNGSKHHGFTEHLIPQSCDAQAMAQESSAANGPIHHGFTEDLIPQSYETQVMPQESSVTNGSKHHGFTEVLNQSLVEAQVTNTVKNNQCDAALQAYSPLGEELENPNCSNDLNHAVIVSDGFADEADCVSEITDSDEVVCPSEAIDGVEIAPGRDGSADEADCPSEITDSDEVVCPFEVIADVETVPSRDSFPIDNISSSKVSASETDYSAVHDVGGAVVDVHYKSMSGTHFGDENVDASPSASYSLLLPELADAGMETIDLSDKGNDEDSCVIVDNSLLYELQLRRCGNRSYKKLLKDFLNSKRRLVKEYKLLAIQHEDLDVVSRRGSSQNEVSIIKTSDAEWEIL